MATTSPSATERKRSSTSRGRARSQGAAPESGARSDLRGWLLSVRELLQHPLAPYHLLLGATALLLAIGLMEVLSASSVVSYREFGNSYHWFFRQLTWVLIGVPIAFLATALPRKLLRALSWPGIVVSLLLIGLTRTSLGVEVNGNQNWLALGPAQVQPAEFAKFCLIIWCADVWARKERHLKDPMQIMIPVLPVFLFALLMVVGWGRDLGTGLILAAILLGLLWVVGAPGRIFGALALAVGVVGLVLASTNSERMSRLTGFSDPFQDYLDTGWQSANGLLGMASGGLFGKNIGGSFQKWGTLPEAHTDFIFAVLGEELGLVGTLLVLALFLAIAWSGFRIATVTKDPFVRYVAAGVTVWLLFQAMINIAMVLALFPVVGVPLPLVSYGGSSLLPELVAIGLLVAFARQEPDAARALARKRKQRRRAKAQRVRSGTVKTAE